MDSTVFRGMLLLVFPDEQDSHIPSPCAETNEEINKKLKPENAYSFKLSFTSCIIYIFRLQMDRSLKKLVHTKKIHFMHIFNVYEFTAYL
jgi:hypothetical protein